MTDDSVTGTPDVSLTTDFGLADGFVAAMHGVIRMIAPEARTIDVTHEVPPGDIRRGAAVLAQVVPYLPASVHVAVVDPGVGTRRRAIALRTPHGLLVGPDNGLLIPAAEALGGIEDAVELTNRDWHLERQSATFHGRDVFAPVGATLATGAPFAGAGATIDPDTLVRLPAPMVRTGPGYVEAEVLTVDRYGNVQLAVDAAAGLAALGTGAVRVGGAGATCGTTFGDVAEGAMVVFGDSAGLLAVAVNRGRADAALDVAPGDPVRITRDGTTPPT